MINESIQFMNTTATCSATAITQAGYPWYILIFVSLGIVYLLSSTASLGTTLIYLLVKIYAFFKWLFKVKHD